MKSKIWQLLAAIAANRAIGNQGPTAPPREATCPECGTKHRTSKEFCSRGCALDYRADRRHVALLVKNGIKGRRAQEVS